MAAVIKVGHFNSTSPGTFNDITVGGTPGKVSYDLSDLTAGTTTLTIPTGTARTFSWIRYLALYCLTGASTTLSNVKYAIAASPALPTGVFMYAGVQATYTQANTTKGTAAGNFPADDVVTTAPAGTPGCTYTAISVDPTFTGPVTNLGGAATTATRVGTNYLQTVVGVNGSYTGGGNANTALPNIEFQYDEA